MSVGVDIAQFLSDNGHGVPGTSIIVGQLTEQAAAQIAVNEYDAGGALDAMVMSPSIDTLTPTVQLMVRGEDWQSTLDRAVSAFNDLIAVRQTNLAPSGNRYEIIQPLNTPTLFERDSKRRVVFVFNVQAMKEQ